MLDLYLVIRGGCWGIDPALCRVTDCSSDGPDIRYGDLALRCAKGKR